MPETLTSGLEWGAPAPTRDLTHTCVHMTACAHLPCGSKEKKHLEVGLGFYYEAIKERAEVSRVWICGFLRQMKQSRKIVTSNF